MMPKIVLLTTITPDTHYSAFLAGSISEKYPDCLSVYCCNNEDIRNSQLRNVKKVWSDSLLYPLQILREVVKEKPEIVHIQHEFRMFGGRYGALIFPLFLVLLRLTKVKIVTTIHWVVPVEYITRDFSIDFGWKGHLLWLQRLFINLTYRSILAHSRKIIVHTEQNKADLIHFYHAQSEQCEIIPHGIPTVQRGSRHGKHHPIAKKILYFGYIHPRKGLEELVRGFRLFSDKQPGWKLVMAGGVRQPAYKELINGLISELQLTKVVSVLGQLSDVEIEEQILSADFMVLPYKYAFSASGPFALAIAYTKPVVATPAGSLAQEIRSTNAGILSEGFTPEEICKAILQMVDHIQSDRLKGFISSMQEVQQQRSWDVVAEMHMDLYAGVGNLNG